MIYDNVKRICNEKGTTLKNVEEQANLGAGCISRWKSETFYPKVSTLKKVADVLGVSLEELVKE